MTDTIFITGVVIHARHGVMEHETEVGQRFVIDLELAADLSESSRTDRLADTVSYSNVVATATAAFKNANYKLLERAAGAVADAVLGAFPRHGHQGDRPQAARADCCDFRRCRSGPDAHPATALSWLTS
jgi:dihydroneopterin aldolase